MASGRVLVVDDTKLITRMIHDKLASAGYEVTEANDGSDALKKAKSCKPDLIILDIMLPGIDGYQLARFVRQDPQLLHIPIMMLSAKAGIQEKIAGFEAGADDYLTKPFDPTELELRVRALITRARGTRGEEEVSPPGRVISVFSLRGGSGTTLLAVNIAATLAQMLDQEIPLVDLAVETGSAGILLDLLPRLTLSHLAKEDVSALDAGLIKEYFAAHASGVRLVAAPATPVLAEVVTPTLVNRVLTTLRGSYSHVVVDTSHTLGELPLAALDISDVIILVVPPDMVSLKSASGALETFASLGYPETRTLIVMNWVFPRRGLVQKEMEAALARSIDFIIPYEGEWTIRSINEGVPLVLSQPLLPWTQAVEGLAYRISSSESRAVAEATGNKRFAAIKKRIPA